MKERKRARKRARWKGAERGGGAGKKTGLLDKKKAYEIAPLCLNHQTVSALILVLDMYTRAVEAGELREE